MADRQTPWQRTREFLHSALRDNDEDFTQGPIGRALGLLAIPMILEMSMESIFAIVDIAFVARLGTDAVAAVGITEALVTILYAVAMGLGMGVTAMVSRRIGARDAKGAAEVTGQSLWVGALLSLGVGLLGVSFARDLLVLMGASASVVATGAGYISIMLGGSFSIIFLFLLNAAFRGAGDATVALRSLWVANGCNIILDPCLIFGLGPFPEMGVTGAAVATTIGRGIGVAYQLSYLLRGSGRLAFRLQHLRPRLPLAARMLRISFGGVGQFLIATSSWIIVMRIVAMFGSPAIAAFTIALRTMEFVYLPAWGLGNAAATLVGQNLGAGQAERAERSAWQASSFNALFMAVTGTILFVFAPTITGWFTIDPEVLRIGTRCMRIIAAGFPLYAIGMVIVQAMNGAGDTETPMTLNLISFWLTQIPAAFVLATMTPLGVYGAFLAVVVSESLLTVLSVIVFRRGGWKKHAA